MKRKIFIMFGVLLFAGLVVAGSLSTWSKEITLDAKQEARIKSSGNVTLINVIISPIQCNSEECWAKVNQKGVINSEWRGSKDYCSAVNETIIDESTGEMDGGCIQYTDYTNDELSDHANAFVERRLKNWADAEEVRKTEVVEDKTAEGIISQKK